MLVVVNNNNKIRLTILALAVYITTENVGIPMCLPVCGLGAKSAAKIKFPVVV